METLFLVLLWLMAGASIAALCFALFNSGQKAGEKRMAPELWAEHRLLQKQSRLCIDMLEAVTKLVAVEKERGK